VSATWCVVTEHSTRFLLDYDGNGGFGPVNVWENGWLVGLRSRHRLPQPGCPVCAEPSSASTYLPSMHWETPDTALSGQPGSGDPDRGQFTAVFSGGPDYPDRPMLVRVVRQDWWHKWHEHSVVELDPHGDWRSAFDRWRALLTGYTTPTPIPAPEEVAT
jgi:hypothetical protein